MDIRFACTGCGKCCTDHHVPLTLEETRQWAARGGKVLILIEAFLRDGDGPGTLKLAPHQQEHARRRSLSVLCGSLPAYVSITFAAYSEGRCRNLLADNRCGIYEDRPLVCRIYPMEINPHIPLTPAAKDCPTEAWESGPRLIHGQHLVDRELAALIERSRQADRDDIAAKAQICTELGIHTAAIKGDGFTTYQPDPEMLLAALDRVALHPAANTGPHWGLHVPNAEFAEQLAQTGALIEASLAQDCFYISLSAA